MRHSRMAQTKPALSFPIGEGKEQGDNSDVCPFHIVDLAAVLTLCLMVEITSYRCSSHSV